MHHNVGGIDQILRIVLGVVICTIGVIYNNWWGMAGLIPLVTGTMSSVSYTHLTLPTKA